MWVDEGWLRTGDMARISEQGDVYIVDSLKELIKSHGYQVAPAELEGLLLDIPDIKDACVASIPDDEAGEVPVAFIALSAGAKARIETRGVSERDAEVAKIKDAVKAYVRELRVRYKWLASVQILDAIPKTPSGKLLRRNLRLLAKDIKADPQER